MDPTNHFRLDNAPVYRFLPFQLGTIPSRLNGKMTDPGKNGLLAARMRNISRLKG